MEEKEEKVPSSQVLEVIKEYLSNPSLLAVNNPRPWVSDFVSVGKFSKPRKEDLFNRAKENLAYFLPNYSLVLMVFLILGV
jgi:PRA1 family protein